MERQPDRGVDMRITSIQMEVKDQSKAQNIADALQLVDEAPESDLMVLPEIWTVGFFSFDRYKAEAETIDGETVSAFRKKAAEKSCFLHMGSFVEKEGDNYYNTSLLLSPEGEIAARYRKIHLFSYQSKEKQILSPGKEITIHETPYGVIGMSTCYDLRFPEMYRLMINRGATLLIVASAWPLVRLEAWSLFNRVRAMENVSFLVSCNCSGANDGNRYAGHSAIVDPLGRIIAEGGEEPELITSEIDPATVKEIRNEFPVLEDRVFYCSK